VPTSERRLTRAVGGGAGVFRGITGRGRGSRVCRQHSDGQGKLNSPPKEKGRLLSGMQRLSDFSNTKRKGE